MSGKLAQGLLTAAQARSDAIQDDATLAAQRARDEAVKRAALDAADKPPAKGAKFRTNRKVLRCAKRNGELYFFKAGVLVTEDPEIIADLRAACASPGSVIWEVK